MYIKHLSLAGQVSYCYSFIFVERFVSSTVKRFNSTLTMSNGRHLAAGAEHPTIPDDGKLRLYSMRFCPFAQRVHLVLDAKDIPYHTIYINLTDKPEWLTKKSPLGKVPALELPNEETTDPLIESLVISEYLDEKYTQNALFPKDPLKKALDKILIERFSSVHSAMYKIFTHTGEGAPPGALTDLSNALHIYEEELNKRGTPFFGGDKPGMLDYMIWPWCERSDMIPFLLGDKYELDKVKFASLLKWRQIMIEDPAVKASYIDGETHSKFLKTRRTPNPEYDMLV